MLKKRRKKQTTKKKALYGKLLSDILLGEHVRIETRTIETQKKKKNKTALTDYILLLGFSRRQVM